MAYCRKCGAPVQKDARFCRLCGTEWPTTGASVRPNRNRLTLGIVISVFVVIIAGLVVVLVSELQSVDTTTKTVLEQEAEYEQKADALDEEKEQEEEKDKTKDNTHDDDGDKQDQDEQEKEKQEQEKQAALEAEHKQLRDEAAANGEQVFEGVVDLRSGPSLAEALGTTMALYGGGDKFYEAEANSRYAMLHMDGRQPVYVSRPYPDDSFTGEYEYIELGWLGYHAYDGSYTDLDYSTWEPYGGMRVCVAVSSCSISDGLSIMDQPSAYSHTRLLYVVNDDPSVNGGVIDL